MTRNWVMKLLTVCVAVSAFVFVFSAYHTATFLPSFPDSATVRWADRYTEVFPTFAVVPRGFFQLTAMEYRQECQEAPSLADFPT